MEDPINPIQRTETTSPSFTNKASNPSPQIGSCSTWKLLLLLLSLALVVSGVRRRVSMKAVSSAPHTRCSGCHSHPVTGRDATLRRCYSASSEGHWDLTGFPKLIFYNRNRSRARKPSCNPIPTLENATTHPYWGIEAARQCLTNRHLMFVGDSVTRFQVFALVGFLLTGVWPIQLPHTPSVCYQAFWPKVLDGDRFTDMDHFMVSLYETFGGNGAAFYSTWNHTAPKENFYDHSVIRFPSPMNLTISFLSWLGDVPLQGLRPNVTLDNSARMAQRDFQNKSDYCLHYPAACWKATNISEAMERYIPELRPTDLFLNSGIWIYSGYGRPFTNDTLELISRAGRRLLSATPHLPFNVSTSPTDPDPPVRLFWKTTTAVAESIEEKHLNATDFIDPIPKRWFERSGWGIYDAAEITHGLPPNRVFYADYVHFQCLVYRELNEYLLDLLCH